MRTLTEHQINECNQAITIEADPPDAENGNASHHYFIKIPDKQFAYQISFQQGPIKDVGTNGITHEVLIAILIDRLRGFQSGPYACQENADALTALEIARDRLHARTRNRVARGVEGTHTV